MKSITIYQTLTDRENPDYIIRNGPFKCSHKKAWLGKGYYFWDTFIENAHWWGEKSLKVPYVICEAKISIDEYTCFDLVGNTEHMLEFAKCYEELKSKKLANSNTNVARVINYLREINSFPYNCIRVNPINSKSQSNQSDYLLRFEIDKAPHLEFKPPIQFCIFNLNKADFKEYQIIYPDYYIDGYVI